MPDDLKRGAVAPSLRQRCAHSQITPLSLRAGEGSSGAAKWHAWGPRWSAAKYLAHNDSHVDRAGRRRLNKSTRCGELRV